jgi:hypothetical protein
VKNGTFVGDIVASGASRGTAFVSFDAHRDGDFAPYIFRTSDFGRTWTAVVQGLPADDASIRALAEFPGHPNVLFAGTERALFVTHDSGGHWTRLRASAREPRRRRRARFNRERKSWPSRPNLRTMAICASTPRSCAISPSY